jgi:hypothetical protein
MRPTVGAVILLRLIFVLVFGVRNILQPVVRFIVVRHEYVVATHSFPADV